MKNQKSKIIHSGRSTELSRSPSSAGENQKSAKPKSDMINSRLGFCLLVGLLFYLFIGSFATAKAQGVNFRTYPSLIKIKSEDATELNSNIYIENLSDSPLEIETQIRLFKADAKADGSIEYLKTGTNPDGIMEKIDLFSDNNRITGLTLGPKQKTLVTVKLLPDESNLDKDYYFSVIFLSKSRKYQPDSASNQQQTSFTALSSGIATNVLLSIHPKNQEQKPNPRPVLPATIEEFSSLDFVEKGPVSFKVKLQNPGNNFIQPKGTIYIKNMFGQLIGKVDIPPQDVLANSSRYLSNQLLQPNAYNTQPSVLWPEKFLLGPYTAELNIQPTPDSPALTKTIHFTAFPSVASGAIILGLIILVLIYKRVKQKMSA